MVRIKREGETEWFKYGATDVCPSTIYPCFTCREVHHVFRSHDRGKAVEVRWELGDSEDGYVLFSNIYRFYVWK